MLTVGNIKINIGCGNNILPDYINIDKYPQTSAVIKMEVDELKFLDNSVNGILANHVLEHISFRKTLIVLKEWYRVLSPRGMCVVEVPDAEWAIKKWLESDEPGSWEEVSYEYSNRYSFWTMMLWGNQENLGQFHCTPFTKKRLECLFKEVGFKIVKQESYISHGGMALLIAGVK